MRNMYVLTGQGRKAAAIHSSAYVRFFIIMTKEEYMCLALKEAEKARNKDEVPIGCIIVKDDKVLARAHNLKEQKQDPTSHAEIECIRKAVKKLGNWHLDDCELYVTLEPCIMCAGAIVHARLAKVYYGAADPKGGAFGSNMNITTVQKLNHYPLYESGVLMKECSTILKDYFKAKRTVRKIKAV